MRFVQIEHNGIPIKIVERFNGPGTGYRDVDDYVELSMPVIRFEVTLENGSVHSITDYRFIRDDLCLKDGEAARIIARARAQAGGEEIPLELL